MTNVRNVLIPWLICAQLLCSVVEMRKFSKNQHPATRQTTLYSNLSIPSFYRIVELTVLCCVIALLCYLCHWKYWSKIRNLRVCRWRKKRKKEKNKKAIKSKIHKKAKSKSSTKTIKSNHTNSKKVKLNKTKKKKRAPNHKKKQSNPLKTKEVKSTKLSNDPQDMNCVNISSAQKDARTANSENAKMSLKTSLKMEQNAQRISVEKPHQQNDQEPGPEPLEIDDNGFINETDTETLSDLKRSQNDHQNDESQISSHIDLECGDPMFATKFMAKSVHSDSMTDLQSAPKVPKKRGKVRKHKVHKKSKRKQRRERTKRNQRNKSINCKEHKRKTLNHEAHDLDREMSLSPTNSETPNSSNSSSTSSTDLNHMTATTSSQMTSSPICCWSPSVSSNMSHGLEVMVMNHCSFNINERPQAHPQAHLPAHSGGAVISDNKHCVLESSHSINTSGHSEEIKMDYFQNEMDLEKGFGINAKYEDERMDGNHKSYVMEPHHAVHPMLSTADIEGFGNKAKLQNIAKHKDIGGETSRSTKDDDEKSLEFEPEEDPNLDPELDPAVDAVLDAMNGLEAFTEPLETMDDCTNSNPLDSILENDNSITMQSGHQLEHQIEPPLHPQLSDHFVKDCVGEAIREISMSPRDSLSVTDWKGCTPASTESVRIVPDQNEFERINQEIKGFWDIPKEYTPVSTPEMTIMSNRAGQQGENGENVTNQIKTEYEGNRMNNGMKQENEMQIEQNQDKDIVPVHQVMSVWDTTMHPMDCHIDCHLMGNNEEFPMHCQYPSEYAQRPHPMMRQMNPEDAFCGGFRAYNHPQSRAPGRSMSPHVPPQHAMMPNFRIMSVEEILSYKLTVREIIELDLFHRLISRHSGSRYLQSLVEKLKPKEPAMQFLCEYLVYGPIHLVHDVAQNKYGNQFIQCLLAKEVHEFQDMILKKWIYPYALRLSQDLYGCRVIQCIIQSKQFPVQCKADVIASVREQLVRISNRNILRNLLKSMHSNHVIQSFLAMKRPAEEVDFIRTELEANLGIMFVSTF